MTMTRETADGLVERLRGMGIQCCDLAATALLAAWDERDAAAAREKALTESNMALAHRLMDHSETANGPITHYLFGKPLREVADLMARAEAAEDENAELKLNATARDVRIFELREELDNAEARLVERDAENAQLRGNITILLHTWRIGDLQDHDFTAALNKEPNP